jgi:cleavage and polyadenylation specificity factor subunit 2
MTREIYTPGVGEILNVSEVTNMYKINLTDALLSSLTFSRLGEYDLAYLVGQVQIPSGSTAPVLSMPAVIGNQEVPGTKRLTAGTGDAMIVEEQGAPGSQQQQQQQGHLEQNTTALSAAAADSVSATSMDTTALIAQQQQLQQQQLEMLAREHQPVFVGDIRLTEFKNRVLRQAGIEAEFMGEGVLVCNGVVAVRKVEETGQILLEGSPMSNDYYEVRRLLYSQFALL